METAADDERSDQLARAHEALAAAQDRSYWLDRWQLDLNALMRRGGASELRAALRALRAIYRTAYNTSDRLRRGIRTLPGHAAGARRVLGEERARGGLTAGVENGVTPASSRLLARPVTERLGERVEADDPHALVAVQRADMLVDALSAAGGTAGPDQRWLGFGTGADAVLTVLSEAFPGLEITDDGVVDVAFAISDWGAGDAPFDRIDELRDVVTAGGRVLLTAESRATAGALTPDRVLAHCTPDWRVSLYLPGGMEGGRDLYVLERA